MPLQINGVTSGSATLQATNAATVTLTLPGTTGTVLSTGSPQSGGVIQVVNAVLSVSTTTTSTTFVDTGLNVSITPKFATSKIFVIVSQAIYVFSGGGNTAAYTQLQRNGTGIFTEGYSAFNPDTFYRSTINFLDSPSTTLVTNYKIQFRKLQSSSTNITYCYGDGSGQTNCEITLMEIAA